MSDFYIQKKDWDKIINYARAREQECGDEIGGMAVIVKDKENDYIIKEPTILKQETTGATCTLDKDELAQYYVDMAHKYGNDVQFLWWHSHAKMAAFWSGTDTSTMTEYKNSSWSAFLVVNVREEYKFRVQYWHPYELGEDIELNIMTNKTKERPIPKNILNQIKEKCSEKVTTVVSTGYTYNKGGYGNYYNSHTNQRTLFELDNLKKQEKNDELNDLLDEYETLVECGYNYYGYSNASIQEAPIAFLIEQLEMGNEKYCEGQINYKKYIKAINEFNDTLERLEGKDSPKIRVDLYSENELLDKCMQLHPYDFITINSTPITVLWAEREEKQTIKNYNKGYNL
ncbi:MAG: hypothetical protein Unbinned4409contig1002_10 [Prokaryotic dsDNA virus sp.]|nr:MAG: hypothetical protein Unbinned4409contig1002_10 [Prokaryotic dsDNA virus sp.]|tara:strand:+ start:5276 stop:6304 length:1029 start_codon:yes stop_codon:yes gene_type:complete